MAYTVTQIEHTLFPGASIVETLFDDLGLPLNELLVAIEHYSCPAPLISGRGYQIALAEDLGRYFEKELQRGGLRPTRSKYELTYSPALNQYADFALVHQPSKRRVLFEIEFRPNYEKDLIKFQIGHNSGILAAGVMIVAIDRKTINPKPPRYPSMPEYRSVIRVVAELKPSYPLVIIGVRGEHAA